jgi:hypothetical protein
MNKLEPIVHAIIIASMMYGIYGMIKLLTVSYHFFI